MKLSEPQKRHLRALGHHLKPVVWIGQHGLKESVLAEIDLALDAHELIKVKLLEAAALDRHEAAEDLATRTQSQVAQVLGNTILLYRRNDDDPVIELP